MSETKKLKILSVFVVATLIVGLAVPASAVASETDPYDLFWHAASSSLTYDGITYLTYSVTYPDEHTTSWWYQMFLYTIRTKNDTAYMSSVLRSFADRTRTSFLAVNQYLLSIYNNTSSILSLVSDIRDFVSPQYKLDLESNQEDNIEQITDDFFSGAQSSSSLGTDDFSDLKSFTAGAGTMLASPVNADQFSNALDVGLSSSGGLGFFSQAVKDELTFTPEVSLQEDEVYLDFYSTVWDSVDLFVGGNS